jgi:hypothetical protein
METKSLPHEECESRSLTGMWPEARPTKQAGAKQSSQSFEVIKDPSSGGSLQEIQIQTAMMEELPVDLNTAAALTAGIENVRRQLEALLATLANDPAEAELLKHRGDSEGKLCRSRRKIAATEAGGLLRMAR